MGGRALSRLEERSERTWGPQEWLELLPGELEGERTGCIATQLVRVELPGDAVFADPEVVEFGLFEGGFAALGL